MLADPRLAAHRRQLPRGRASGTSPRTTPASPATRPSWPTTWRPRPRCSRANGYATLDGRQVAPVPRRRHVRRRPEALLAAAARLRPLLRLPRRVHQPPPAASLIEDNHHGGGRPRIPTATTSPTTSPTRAIDDGRSERKARNPRQPFFLYFAHPAAHAPLHGEARRHGPLPRPRTTPGGTRSAPGATRARSSSGVLPPGTPLPPRNSGAGDDVAPWDELSDDEQTAVRPVHGGLRGDGRQHRPERRATARRPGGDGRVGQHDRRVRCPTTAPAARARRPARRATSGTWRRSSEARPSDRRRSTSPASTTSARRATMAHYPRGWAMASNTPFRLYKRNTHAGGHQVPCVWSWPERWPPARSATTRAIRRPVRARDRRAADRARRSAGVAAATERNGIDAAADGRRQRSPACWRRRRPTRPAPSSTTSWRATAASTATGGRSSPTTGPHAVQRRRVGALRPRRAIRSSSTTSPPSKPELRRRAAAALRPGRPRQPGVPARRGLRLALGGAPAVRATSYASRSRIWRRHADARAVPQRQR